MVWLRIRLRLGECSTAHSLLPALLCRAGTASHLAVVAGASAAESPSAAYCATECAFLRNITTSEAALRATASLLPLVTSLRPAVAARRAWSASRHERRGGARRKERRRRKKAGGRTPLSPYSSGAQLRAARHNVAKSPIVSHARGTSSGAATHPRCSRYGVPHRTAPRYMPSHQPHARKPTPAVHLKPRGMRSTRRRARGRPPPPSAACAPRCATVLLKPRGMPPPPALGGASDGLCATV